MQTDAGVDGPEPAFDLVEFISRFVPLCNEGNEKVGPCVFCDAGGHRLKVGATWRTGCCCAHEIHGNDKVGFYACWTNAESREEAIAKLGNGQGLPDAKPIEQRPLQKLPFWGWRGLNKQPDKPAWIHELSGSVLVWRELAPERVHLGIIEGRSWDNLAIVAPPRKVVLIPENNAASRVKMQRLAAALYHAGHKKVMRLELGLDPDFGTRELPKPDEDVIKWAMARSVPYPAPGAEQTNAAPQAELPAGQSETGVSLSSPGSHSAQQRLEEAAPALGDTEDTLTPPIAQPEPPRPAASRGNGAGTPLPPAERVKDHERKDRAEVLSQVVYTCIANVRPEAVQWLWPGRIPLGELTMIVGDPGLGKSQICSSLASVVTNGGQWPVDRSHAQKGSVLILSAEDNIKHTIRPRLDAAHADVSKCHTLLAVRRISEAGTSFEGGFSLAEDLAKLSALMDEIGDVRLVVIDPVSAYLGETDSHKNAEVRGMLAPLTTLAGNHDAAIILVSHLTKSQSANALMRVQGSIAFAALCRAVWGVTADKENRQRRLFMPLKNNLGQDKTGLAYSIESAVLDIPDEAGEPIPTSRIMWESELVETSVDEAFGAALSHEERSEVDDAKEFLRDALAQGRVKASEVQSAATRAGHKHTTIGRAKRAMGILSIPEGFAENRVWFWQLKAASQEELAPRWEDPR
jgi:archaellum biogenesis ATPase FlaH